MKVSLVIPLKNEIVGLKVILPRIKKEWVHELIFVDGASTDDSVAYIESFGYQVTQQAKPGLAEAWWTGLDLAKGDAIILFSPDNNSVPEDIPKLIEKMKEGYDMVVASRYAKGASSEDDNFASGFANFFFTRLINFLFRARYTDAGTMYKIFKRSLLVDLDLVNNRIDNFEFLLACRAAKRRLKIADIPSNEPSRLDDGGSRAHPGPFGKVKSGLRFIVIVFREWLQFK